MNRTADAVWQDLDLVLAASEYAARAHQNDLRKATAIPYLSHLWSVAALVMEHGGDDQQVAAGLLHDTAEDHGGLATIEDIRTRFGDEVARLVEGLSDSLTDTDAGEAKARWEERKRTYLAHLAAADPRVKLVSACDKLHNLRCIVADHRATGDDLWQRFNVKDPQQHLWYYRSLSDALQPPDVPEALATELASTVDDLAAQLEEHR